MEVSPEGIVGFAGCIRGVVAGGFAALNHSQPTAPGRVPGKGWRSAEIHGSENCQTGWTADAYHHAGFGDENGKIYRFVDCVVRCDRGSDDFCGARVYPLERRHPKRPGAESTG